MHGGRNRNTKPARSPSTLHGNRISASFLGLCAIFAVSGGAMYWGVSYALIVMPFIFVVSGWMIALCLHEFGHALVAYHGGDREIAQTGYLTLDPLSYTHPVYSIIMPVIFVILGYIALPGGAVYVRTSSLYSPYWDTAVSAAGPFMTLLCLCAAVAPFALGLHLWTPPGKQVESFGFA